MCPLCGQQDLQRRGAGLVPEIEGGDHRIGHQGGIADLGEVDPPKLLTNRLELARSGTYLRGRHPRSAKTLHPARPWLTRKKSAESLP